MSENEKIVRPNKSDNPREIEKSAEIIFREVVRQYNLQMDSHDTLKDKANSIITASGTIITVITLFTIQVLNLDILHIKKIVIIFIVPYYFLIQATLYALKSYFLIELETIDAESFFNKYYKRPKIEILEQLSSNIAASVTANKIKADERKKYVNIAMESLGRGIITFTVSVIIIICIYIFS